MRWGRKRVKRQREEKMNSSSSFSFSNVLPPSWLSKLRNLSSKPKPPPSKTGPVSFPPPPPSPRHPSDSDHLSFSPAALDHLIARFPASFLDAGNAPRRRYIGEDDSLHARDRTIHRRRRRRRRRRRSKPVRDGDGASEETEGFPTKPPLASDPDRTAENRGGGEARKSFSGRIRPKVWVCSPRPSAASRAEMGRIKAATARRRVEAEEKTGLESFAVVKCSCDPQKDFRESMVEMICEKGIGQPEELESLLACYLSLNSDEHHDLIVKVFRQVWFDLNPERFSSHRFDD